MFANYTALRCLVVKVSEVGVRHERCFVFVRGKELHVNNTG